MAKPIAEKAVVQKAVVHKAQVKAVRRKVRAFRQRSKLSLVLILLVSIAEACFYGLIPVAVGVLFDRALQGTVGQVLPLSAAALAIGALVVSMAALFRDSLYSKLQSRALGNLRQTMFERLQKFSLSFHSRVGAAEILERFTRDFPPVESALAQGVQGGLRPLLGSLVYTGLVFSVDRGVGVLSLLMWLWVPAAAGFRARAAVVAEESWRAQEEPLLGLVEESLPAQPILRAFSLEWLCAASFRKRNSILTRLHAGAAFLPALRETFADFGVLLLRIAVIWLSLSLFAAKAITAGMLLALLLLSPMLSAALRRLTLNFSTFTAGKRALDQLELTFHDRSPAPGAPGEKRLARLKHKIVFDRVDFNYASDAPPGAGEPNISQLTAGICRGSHVAFVGSGGAGKTTLLHLLLRLYEPAEGTITFDGVDLRTATTASLRAQIGIVPQENFVFTATMRENIRLGRPDATDETMGDAARAAGIYELVSAMPQGFDTLGGSRGVQLSPETSQRLAIARALIRNPEILVLDEVAAALDPLAEAAVWQTLRPIMAGRTVISLAYRLATVADADHIFVLRNGHIVEQGNHAALLAGEGYYASLWATQSGFRLATGTRHYEVDPARLRQIPALENLNAECLTRLAVCFATERFPADREIVRAGDPEDKLFILVRGKAEVWRTDRAAGATVRVRLLQDGDSFGEAALLPGWSRTTETVRALTDCICVELERFHFERLRDQAPRSQASAYAKA